MIVEVKMIIDEFDYLTRTFALLCEHVDAEFCVPMNSSILEFFSSHRFSKFVRLLLSSSCM